MKQRVMEFVKSKLDDKRYQHSLNVAKVAIKLANIYKADEEKAEIAAILHDNAKQLNYDEMVYYINKYNIKLKEIDLKSPQILHAYIGAYIAKEQFEIDEDIFNSIYYHTVGRKNMSMLEKIIFISDVIEEDRIFEGVEELREMAYKDIDKSIIMSCDLTIKYVLSRGLLLHNNTVDLRNSLILNGGLK